MNAALDEVRFGWAREYFERRHFAETVAQLTQMESDNLEGLASFQGEVVNTLAQLGKDDLVHQLAKRHLEKGQVSTATYVLYSITGPITNDYRETAQAIFDRSMHHLRYDDAIKAAFFIRERENVSLQLLILGEGLRAREPDLAASALTIINHKDHEKQSRQLLRELSGKG